MEMKVNSELVVALRNQRAWSQDELATASGISLRTIQRIENLGTCSLESKKALAAVFEIDVLALEIDEDAIVKARLSRRGHRNGVIGATVGCGCALIAIVFSYTSGGSSLGETGIYLGILGAVYGSCCALIGYWSRKQQGLA